MTHVLRTIMRRREFITFLGSAAAWPIAARAQSRGVPLIGVLSPISAVTAAPYIDALRAGLRDLGYIEGRDIALELRFAEGAIERLARLAAELVALQPAVIITGSPPATRAVREVTTTIPIIMNSSENPITLGLAASLPHPGGNVTGFWWGDEGLIGKRLELLKQTVPTVSRVGILIDPNDPNTTEPLKSLAAATQQLGLMTRIFELRSPADFAPAFAIAAREKLHAFHVSITPLFIGGRAELVALAADARIPVVYPMREFVTMGGLMSYGTSLPDIYRRKARMVDKILTGTNPAELPIERLTNYEFVVNLKTASELGLTPPPAVLALADEVIE